MTDVRVPAPPALLESGVMAILRAPSAGHYVAIGRALAEAGIRCLEVTLTTPGAMEAIRSLRQEIPELSLGAGTVLTPAEATEAIAAGAEFIVAPDTRADVIRAARDVGVASFPGALTPTEIATAWEVGATAIKIFPGSAVGPGYISALHGPFPDIPMMPTGGVALDDIGAWIRAGAIGVGLGGPLQGDAAAGGDLAALAARATQALAAVAAARSES